MSQSLRREKPDIVIAQYDYDSSIIKAAVDENKKIIVYVHIWWPVCPKITLFTYEGTICQGFTNSDCKTCASKTYKGGATKYALLLLTNNKIHKKMRNRIDLLNKDDVTTVVLSSHMKEYFVNFGLPEEKIKILPNGITCKNFTIDNDTREKIVCYYGGESDFKGFEIFYTIAKILNTKYPDIQFIATGNYQNKSPLVKYVGMLDREKLKSLYAKSKCTVIPSIWDDPFPAVALESMAAGTPVVAFDVGSLSSIIHNEVGGFVVPLMGIDEMADKIIRVVNDDKLFAKLSENARRIACEEFTEDKRIALLNEIINKSSR